MIINANGVNVDTNTQRTDSEIVNLITTNTSNMMTRTLLKTVNVNQTLNQSPFSATFGGFTLSETQALEYALLYVEFKGTIQVTSTGGNGGLDFEIVNGTNEGSLARIEAYANYPTTLNNFSTLLIGGSITRTRSSSGGTTTSRFYNSGVSGGGVSINGSQISFKLTGYNGIGNSSINGTINIYGIK